MKDKRSVTHRPKLNEQNDPVFCSKCGMAGKNGGKEEDCICEFETESSAVSNPPSLGE